MIKNAVKALQKHQEAINEQIQSLQAEAGKLEKALSILGKLSKVVTGKPQPPKAKKRKMSAAGRKAIAAGARKRWAAIRAKKAGKAAPTPVKKRKMSAAGRKAIAEAAKARWAKIRAAKGTKAPAAPKAERPQNKISLMEAVLKVLHPEKAQSIPEIILAVEKNGYVSNSESFATIIGQTLRKAGDKVVRVRRGMYALNG